MITLTSSQVFANAEFLRPLVDQMTEKDPMKRPTAEVARSQWFEIRKDISFVSREWRPRPREELILVTMFWDLMYLYRLLRRFAYTIIMRLPRW